MQVYQNPEAFAHHCATAATIGTFDGVHVGHQKIINRLVEQSKKIDLESLILTFWPHPRQVLQPDLPPLPLLFTLEEKLEAFEKLGVHHVVIAQFNKAFASQSAEHFVKNVLLASLNVKHLIIGYDHKFGNKREGDLKFLEANSASFGFEVEEIPPKDIDDIAVSSTKIRQALLSGEIDLANSYIGRPYSFKAIVKAGDRLGRTIGFPTANLSIPEPLKLIPKTGVYAVKALWQDKAILGMLNIGHRPTVGGKELRLEVHLLDFNQDIYHQELQVSLLYRLREERKFENLEELKIQLEIDKKEISKLL